MTQNTNKKEIEVNPLDLSARFLAARPDLVGAWIIGAHSILPMFKSKHKEAINMFLETIQTQFFTALRHHFEKKNEDQKLTFTFGTICKNNKGEERLVIGIRPEKSGKPTYEYIADFGELGACNESSMNSWMEK